MTNATTNVSEHDAIATTIQHYIDGAKSGKGEAKELLDGHSADPMLNAALVFASSLATSFDRWFTRRANTLAMKQLYALDDRLLKDIGLHRSQIESVVLTGAPNGDRKVRFWSA